jgi:hypothetical protein
LIDVDETIKYLERLLGRTLTGEELLIVAVSYQQGIIRGLYEKGSNLPDKNEKE